MNNSQSNNTLILAVNAPPYAGKDTLAKYVAEKYGFCHLSIAARLKQMTHSFFGLSDFPYDYFEDCKDTPSKYFNQMTPRQAYINYGQGVLANYGKHRLINQIVVEILKNDSTPVGFVISDVGFEHELTTLRSWFKASVYLINIFNGELDSYYHSGETFPNDSRRYIKTIASRNFHLHNKKDDQFFKDIDEMMTQIL
jgi:hypothetical protein